MPVLFNTLILLSNFFCPLLLALLYVLVWSALRRHTRKRSPSVVAAHLNNEGTTAAQGPSAPAALHLEQLLPEEEEEEPARPALRRLVSSIAGAFSSHQTGSSAAAKKTSRDRKATKSMVVLTSTFLLCQVRSSILLPSAHYAVLRSGKFVLGEVSL